MGVRLLTAQALATLTEIARHSVARQGFGWTASDCHLDSLYKRRGLYQLLDRGLVETHEGTGHARIWQLTIRGLEVITLAWPPHGDPGARNKD